jgi:hypothetical protein
MKLRLTKLIREGPKFGKLDVSSKEYSPTIQLINENCFDSIHKSNINRNILLVEKVFLIVG